MKYSILLFLLLTLGTVKAQSVLTLEKTIYDIYREEVDPYLKAFAKNRYPDEENDELEARRALYMAYSAKILVVESKTTDILTKNPRGRDDKGYIAKLLNNKYADAFPGLPKEFWVAVEKRVEEL